MRARIPHTIKVITDPDGLAGLAQIRRLSGRERRDWTSAEWPEWETLDYVAGKAYESLTGEHIYDAVDHRSRTRPRRQYLSDEQWDFEDPHQAALRLPRLVELFPTTDQQRRQAFNQQLAARGMSPAAFHFGTQAGEGADATETSDDGDTATARPERTREWLRQWKATPGEGKEAAQPNEDKA